MFEIFKDFIFRSEPCTVVCTRNRTTDFLLNFFFEIEKFTEKTFQSRVARRYAIKARVSRLNRNFFEISYFLVNGSKCIRSLQNPIHSQTLREATGTRFCRRELERDSKSPERSILFIWNKIKLYWCL